jgi:site-specific DNA recombinase
MRVAIYARYSSDMQREASIEDQVEVCRRYADTNGWRIVDVFSDRAISGANSNRPGYMAMQEAGRAGAFDVILAESLDRLSRRVADVAALHDELTFNRVALHTVATGEVTALLAGVIGAVGQQYLIDLKEKTKRGLLGRVLDGKSGGGLAFGYRLKSEDRGAREIEPGEARIVERIFRDFAAGHSPRAIAKALNAEGVRGPGGRTWRDTMIRGQRDRGTGVLNNELYIGRLVWNRCSYVKDPQTGRRQARPNPPNSWEIVEVPELHIIDDTLWDAVKARQQSLLRTMGRDSSGNPLNRAHRRKFLLSGLLRCGQCGGGYTIIGKDIYGCAARRSKGTCANQETIRREELEHRVLTSLRTRLMAPELVSVFIEEYTREVSRQTRDHAAANAGLERDAAAVDRKIAGILSAIEDGLYSPSMKQRLADLESKKREIEDRIAEPPPTTPRIHPNVHKVYERKVADLVATLNGGNVRAEAADILRGLIDKIVLSPMTGAKGCSITVHGDLATILAFCETGGAPKEKGSNAIASKPKISVVAGVGFEPTTFRL